MSKSIKKILDQHKLFTKERNWDQFQNPKNLSMALSVEASELAEVFMWLTEKQSMALKPELVDAARDEIADVFIYLIKLADTLGIDLIEAAEYKMKKNIEKHPVGKALALTKLLNEY